MADTALTIITDALLDLGVIADEEVPTASQAVGALRKLNNMLEAWNIENLMVFGATANILPTIAGQGVYTIGPGGNLDIPRPDNIMSAYVRNTSLAPANQMDYPLYLYNNQEWQDIAFKGLTASWPNWGVYFDYTYPLIYAYLNPVPSTSQYSIVIWTSGLLSSLTQNQVISLPAGYKRAITANLCIELAASYGVEVPQTVLKIAQDSKADLKTQNFQLNTLDIDPRLERPWFNILTGYGGW